MVYTKHQGRSTPLGGKDRSKRQERVGHLVRTELATILHRGEILGDVEFLEDDLRKRISVVHADVSPDLRQARVTISVRKSVSRKDKNNVGVFQDDHGIEEEDDDEDEAESAVSTTTISNPTVDKRRAYSWLVRNTKPIRHTLAQRMSHMKSCPTLTFAQVDVAAAVDVMYLIDKVSAGYKREKLGEFGGDDDSLPRGLVGGIDFDEDIDDDEWDDEE